MGLYHPEITKLRKDLMTISNRWRLSRECWKESQNFWIEENRIPSLCRRENSDLKKWLALSLRATSGRFRANSQVSWFQIMFFQQNRRKSSSAWPRSKGRDGSKIKTATTLIQPKEQCLWSQRDESGTSQVPVLKICMEKRGSQLSQLALTRILTWEMKNFYHWFSSLPAYHCVCIYNEYKFSLLLLFSC